MSARDPLKGIKGINMNVLSPKARERLRRVIANDRERMQGRIVVERPNGLREGNPQRLLNRYASFMDPAIQEDKGEIMNRMRRYQKALRDGEPTPLTKKDRTKVEMQIAKDREWLKKQMCKRSLYHVKDSHPDFREAVKACNRERDPRFTKVAHRYKSLMRTIDPENPDAANIERLRPN